MGEYARPGAEVDAGGFRIAIVVGRYNEDVTTELLAGARRVLDARGVADDDVTVAWVPGCFELPLVADRLAPGSDAVIALGAVVRGDTPHFDYVAGACAHGLARVALDQATPVVFGVLTTDTMRQALDRIGGPEGHKGEEAAMTAIEMVAVLRTIPALPDPAAAGAGPAPG